MSKAEALAIEKFFLTPQNSQAAANQWRIACDNVRPPRISSAASPDTTGHHGTSRGCPHPPWLRSLYYLGTFLRCIRTLAPGGPAARLHFFLLLIPPSPRRSCCAGSGSPCLEVAQGRGPQRRGRRQRPLDQRNCPCRRVRTAQPGARGLPPPPRWTDARRTFQICCGEACRRSARACMGLF